MAAMQVYKEINGEEKNYKISKMVSLEEKKSTQEFTVSARACERLGSQGEA